MFSGPVLKGALVKEGRDGLWAVHRDTPQYRAWKAWLAQQFGKRFFPDWLTTLGQWPPTSVAGARSVAQWLSDIRDEVGCDIAVTRYPDPWDGVVPKEEENT